MNLSIINYETDQRNFIQHTQHAKNEMNKVMEPLEHIQLINEQLMIYLKIDLVKVKRTKNILNIGNNSILLL